MSWVGCADVVADSVAMPLGRSFTPSRSQGWGKVRIVAICGTMSIVEAFVSIVEAFVSCLMSRFFFQLAVRYIVVFCDMDRFKAEQPVGLTMAPLKHQANRTAVARAAVLDVTWLGRTIWRFWPRDRIPMIVAMLLIAIFVNHVFVHYKDMFLIVFFFLHPQTEQFGQFVFWIKQPMLLGVELKIPYLKKKKKNNHKDLVEFRDGNL